MSAHPSNSFAVAAIAVVRRLQGAGHTAYFAGGCVRDMLLGLSPADYDVATDALPGRVRELFSSTQAVGAAFGVILVRQASHVIEVATFRSDGAYRDGRRPESVTFTTADADAQRRDFTINGMFFDPTTSAVIDYVGGQHDLRNRTLRAIGDADDRFSEDQLRLLRAVRFAARFNLAIEPSTRAAIARHAPALSRISSERIAGELRRMLMPPTRAAAIAHLRALGLLPVLLRFLPGASGDLRLFDAALTTAGSDPISFGFALALLVLDTRSIQTEPELKPWLEVPGLRSAAQAMRQALKISNDEFDQMIGTMDVGHLLHAEPPNVAVLKRFLARPTSPDAVRLLQTVRQAGFFADRIELLLHRFDSFADTDVAPVPLVTGDDLASAGAVPGPSFKRALDAAYDAQLEGSVTSRDAAMAVAMQFIRG